jgi:hypothetical protein
VWFKEILIKICVLSKGIVYVKRGLCAGEERERERERETDRERVRERDEGRQPFNNGFFMS